MLPKSHISSTKNITLPRLELKAAVIAAHLAKFISTTLQLALEVRLWSDSQISLHWIFSNKQLKPFVANRAQEINNLFPSNKWGYCPTTDNAADLLTRGITSTQFQSSQLWV